jgi:hypothetical protein
MIAPAVPGHDAVLAFALDLDIPHDIFDWAALAPVAEVERMTLRVAAWFEKRTLPVPAGLATSVDKARARQQRVADLAACIMSRCDARGVPFVFPKLRQRAPDTGTDLDVLVGAEFSPGLPQEWSGVPVDVQCRRLGHLGEHARFAERVLARRVRNGVGAESLPQPSAEDALLLLTLGRVYGRPALRLSDVAYAARIVREAEVDPDLLLANAREVGLQSGLACFLHFADQVCQQLLDLPVLGAALRRRLPSGPWGRVAYRDGAFRASVGRVSPILYLRLFASDVAAGDWVGARRLSLLPLAAASRGLHRTRPTPPRRSANA